jgi:hypothetical protein
MRTWRERQSRKTQKKNSPRAKASAKRSRKRRIKEAQALILEAKKSGCWICHEAFPPALDLHHVRPELKKHAKDSAGRASTKSQARRYISECAVICSNCHRKLHHGFDFGFTFAESIPSWGIRAGEPISAKTWLLAQVVLKQERSRQSEPQMELYLVESHLADEKAT